jgi:hypothetical protein
MEVTPLAFNGRRPPFMTATNIFFVYRRGHELTSHLYGTRE